MVENVLVIGYKLLLLIALAAFEPSPIVRVQRRLILARHCPHLDFTLLSSAFTGYNRKLLK